jgi:hypothetical protein
VTLFHRRFFRRLSVVCTLSVAFSALAQTSTPGTAQNQPQTTTEPAQNATPDAGQPRGQVLIQSHGDAPAPASTPAPDQLPQTPEPPPNESAQPQLTDADRASISITSYDLDIRITPSTSTLTGRAKLTVQNTSAKPLPRIALQISSSLAWESASLNGQKLAIAQHHLDTDADHTGQASELILTLPTPLQPGATITIDTFYTGTILQNSGRLDRLGASPDQALATDWDAITADSTALRGFGNVLWFPVAAPQLFLSDGSLVPAVDKARLAHAEVPVHLRLSVEYTGDAPVAAYFCGRRQPLTALHDNPDALVAFGSGIATANFPAEPIGIRPFSLFILPLNETLIAPLPNAGSSKAKSSSTSPNFSSSTANPPALEPNGSTGAAMLAVETTDNSSLTPLTGPAERIAPLLQDWLGPHPLSTLTLIDHPGQPFEDGPLLVAPLSALGSPGSGPLLAHSLTHAWVQTGQPWMDEGLAEFFSLLWIEREKGRDAAVAQLSALMQPVIAAESTLAASTPSPEPPDTSAKAADSSSSSSAELPPPTGQPLITAADELFYRHKATAVWWMLRDIVGDQPLQLALTAWRTQPPLRDSPEAQAHAFEALLEKTSGKDLTWFFDDWVLHDRGLPDLSIVDITPRPLPAGTGHDAGWLVAVTMRNQGTAAAEVPLVIRSGSASTTKRVRIPAMSSITERTVIPSPPTEVVLNDGSTPETGVSLHTRTVVQHTEQ